MPKSGFSANSQAKVVANAIRGDLTGSKVYPARFSNTCWSLVATNDGVKVGASYKAGAEKIDVVEISEEMIKAWKSISEPSSLGKSFDHKNVNLHIMDGRRFLRRAMANGEKYDLIQIGEEIIKIPKAKKILF